MKPTQFLGLREVRRFGRSCGGALEQGGAFADSSLESADQAEPSQELTCADIDTFVANSSRILDARQQGTLRPGFWIAPYFACFEGPAELPESLD